MDHMEYSIVMPPHVELTNAGAEWTAMKQRHLNHLNPNSTPFHQPSPANLFTSFLISISLEQVQEVFNMLGLSVEEALRFNKILKSIEDMCLPRFLIIYNRYRFFMCKQNGPEFNGFLQQLLAWSDLCEFGELKDILLKDLIISGISEESVRQHLLGTEQLDFNKTVEICKAGLVKHHASVPDNNAKSTEHKFVDAWTDTSKDIVENNNSFFKPQMVDKAVGTAVAVVEKETLTDELHLNGTFTAGCELMEEVGGKEVTHLMDTPNRSITVNNIDNLCINDILNDSIINMPLQGQLEIAIEISKTHSENSSVIPLLQEQINNVDLVPENISVEFTEKNVKEIEEKIDNEINSNSMSGLNYEMKKCNPEPNTSNLRRSLRNRKSVKYNDNNDEGEKTNYSSDHIQKFKNSDHKLSQKNQQLNRTLSSSRTKSKFECKMCNAVFSDAASMKTHNNIIHQQTHHNVNDATIAVNESKKRLECKLCPSTFSSKSHLKVHLRLHSGMRPFICNTCGKGYTEASKLKNHKRNHSNERPYKCSDCPMSFKWSAAFLRHKRTHSGERPYNCKYENCDSTFADLTSLQRHTQTHTKTYPYRCVCGSSFANSSSLHEHKRIHSGDRPYSCSVCNSSFIRAQHLKEHQKLHTGVKPFECEFCSAKFTEASKLKSHRRKHTGERPYACTVCDKSFAWRVSYNRHMKTHTLEKPYVCRTCRRAFADRTTLVRHQHTHTGERPYSCDQCLSTFTDSSSLSRHKKTHSNDKAYTCDICNASFAIKSYLNRHLRIHTGEKPYQCNVCSARFGDSSKLNRHKKIHTRGKSKTVENQNEDQTAPMTSDTNDASSDKSASFFLWQTEAPVVEPQINGDVENTTNSLFLPNPSSSSADLVSHHQQIQDDQDMSQYLSRELLQFDHDPHPTQDAIGSIDRPGQDFIEDFSVHAVASSVLDDILNIKS